MRGKYLDNHRLRELCIFWHIDIVPAYAGRPSRGLNGWRRDWGAVDEIALPECSGAPNATLATAEDVERNLVPIPEMPLEGAQRPNAYQVGFEARGPPNWSERMFERVIEFDHMRPGPLPYGVRAQARI